MSDRLADLVIGLQRMAENARIRGDDLRYSHQQETYDHIQWLDQLVGMVEKVRTVLMEERKKFMPVENRQVARDQTQEAMPKFLEKGPRNEKNPG